MTKKLNLAVMGCGQLAEKVALTLNKLGCINCYAAVSRTLSKAQDYAKTYNFLKAYGSYEEAVKDPNIDLVWIATPHSEHAKYIKLCAENGKNVICEKAFTLSEREAEEAIECAKKNNVFLSEAIWSRYVPMAKTLSDFLNSGKLGKIYSITCNLCYNRYYRTRIHTRELGGGALLDVGVYCLNFIDLVAGLDIKNLFVNADIDSQTKVDKAEFVSMTLENGVKATMYCSMINGGDRRGVIHGENGFVVVENINNFESISFYGPERDLIETINAPKQISGYEYEFEEACSCICNNIKEAPSYSLGKTVKMMQTMDYIRSKMGVTYPCDSCV